MASYIELKKSVRVGILEAVKERGPLDKEKTLAEYCLKTGLREATVKKIIGQMAELNYIVIDDNIIRDGGG